MLLINALRANHDTNGELRTLPGVLLASPPDVAAAHRAREPQLRLMPG